MNPSKSNIWLVDWKKKIKCVIKNLFITMWLEKTWHNNYFDDILVKEEEKICKLLVTVHNKKSTNNKILVYILATRYNLFILQVVFFCKLKLFNVYICSNNIFNMYTDRNIPNILFIYKYIYIYIYI